jgi:hypothetical protein
MTKEELIKLGVPEDAAQKIAEALQTAGAGKDGQSAEIASLKAALAGKDKTHAAEIQRMKVDAAIEKALTGSKAKNIRAVRALLDIEKAELAEDGTVKGLTEQIKKLQTAEDSKFLFDAGGAKPVIRGAEPVRTGVEAPDGALDANNISSYEQLAAYMDANPGVKI